MRGKTKSFYAVVSLLAFYDLETSKGHTSFLVCGHTKNLCDGSFGYVKLLLRRTDVRTPADMMRVVDDSSKTTVCIPSVDIQWRNWKKILGDYFIIPHSFELSQYQEFCFDSRRGPGEVMARKLCTSESYETFKLLKIGKAEDAMPKDWTVELNSHEFRVVIPDLSKVPSKVKGTRRGYLDFNVLENYYSINTEKQQAYFEDGTRGLHTED